ncbi:MAG: PBP1A family penicillin-binding protein [Acidobacteria bacterium]|nr:PBP1A family penicillin-binding protein [Acidobacteriota bacterium]
MTFLTGLTLAIAVGVYLYVEYSNLVNERLRAGAFANTSMLFAAPQRIATGDTATPAEIATILRRSGYSESRNAAMGYYNLRPDAIEVYPGPDSYFKRDPGVIKFNGGQVSQIISLQDNTEIPQYMLEPELITNLFDKQRQKRRAVKFEDIPEVMRNAILAAEDKRFFSHPGFDPFRIVGAAIVDLRDRRRQQGASTLSMQLARTLMLNSNERTWKRKISEVLITMQLEQKLSKQEIFEYYANTIYLGQRGSFSIHGFGEAANVFFDKDLAQITLPEAALIAGQVQSPNARNPFRYPERARTRRNIVLGMMRDDGLISPQQYEEAVATPIKLAAEENESTEAPYFVDLVNDTLQSKFQDHDFQANSYKVYTSLDMDLQRDAVAAIKAGLSELDPILKRRFKGYGQTIPEAQVAMVCLDPHTGGIKALVGGRNYGQSQLNRTQSRRPPGSVFKPLVYTAALNTGINDPTNALTPVSTFIDEPTTFYYDNDKTYEPSNFHEAFFGKVTLRYALTKSLNIPTVKVAEKVGYRTVLDLARRAGLTMDAYATPAIALGSVGVTPIEMAGAYTMFANHGEWIKPNFLGEIRDQNGTSIFQLTPERRWVLDPKVAYMMTNLMEDVLQTGTGASVRARGFALPAAGKTGTSRDAWFAGYTSKLLCIVWVGFDDYRDIKTEGAQAALPIWTEFMKRAHQHRMYRNVSGFDAPDGVVSAEIDPDSGQLATSGCPNVKTEVFVAGTQPLALCHLHGGGGTQVASWDTPETPAAASTPATSPAPAAPVRSGGSRTVKSIPVEPTSPPAPPAQPKQRGIMDRIRGIFGK